MADPRLEAALAIARERYAALAGADTDAFEATLERHEAACEALAPLVEGSSPADIAALNELIALEEQTLQLTREVTASLGARMATLNAGGKTTAAYRPAR